MAVGFRASCRSRARRFARFRSPRPVRRPRNASARARDFLAARRAIQALAISFARGREIQRWVAAHAGNRRAGASAIAGQLLRRERNFRFRDHSGGSFLAGSSCATCCGPLFHFLHWRRTVRLPGRDRFKLRLGIRRQRSKSLLDANESCWAGRPFVDKIELTMGVDPRAAGQRNRIWPGRCRGIARISSRVARRSEACARFPAILWNYLRWYSMRLDLPFRMRACGKRSRWPSIALPSRM